MVWVVSEHVVVLELQVFYQPFGALSVTVVPGAEATSLLWPQVDHLSGLVEWVRDSGGNAEGESNKTSFAKIIADIIVHPPEEKLILDPDVEVAISHPEHELTCCNWECTLKQVSWSFFHWNS